MKRIAYILIGFLLLIIVALFAVPHFIDWSMFKDDIRLQARKATGYEIFIEGEMHASFLPRPAIEVNHVRVTNGQPDSKPLVMAGKLEVTLGLLSLIQGDIKASSIKLERPDITLHVNAAGQKNWAVERKKAKEGAEKENQDVSSSREIALDKVTIKEGSFSYLDETKKSSVIVQKFNAIMKADSIKGPFSVQGQFAYNALPVNIDIETQAIHNTMMPFELKLGTGKHNTKLQVAGTLGVDKPYTLNGQAAFTSEELSAFLEKMLLTDVSPLIFVMDNISVRSPIQYQDKTLSFNEIKAGLGQTNINGSVVVAMAENRRPHAVIDLTADTYILPSMQQTTGTASKQKKDQAGHTTYMKQLAYAYDAVQNAFEHDIKFGLDMNSKIKVNEIALSDYAIRDVFLHMLVSGTAIDIKELKARLPAETDFSASGQLSTTEKKMSFVSKSKTKNLNGLVKAITGNESQLANDFAFNARLTASLGTMSLEKAAVTYGNTSATASLTYTPEKDVPVDLKMDMQNVDLIAFARGDASQNTQERSIIQSKNGHIGLADEYAKKLQDMIASFSVTASGFETEKMNIKNLMLQGELNNLVVTIREARLQDQANTKMALSGRFENIAPIEEVNIDYHIASPDLESFLKNAGLVEEAPLLKQADMKLSLVGKLDSDMKIDAGGALNGATYKIDGIVSNIKMEPTYQGEVTVNHTETRRFIEAFLGYKPEGINIGRLIISADVKGAKDRFDLSNFYMQIGRDTIEGNAALSLQDDIIGLNAKMDGDRIVLSDLLPGNDKDPKKKATSSAGPQRWSNDVIDLTGLKKVEGQINFLAKEVLFNNFQLKNAAMNVIMDKGKVSFENVGADLFGGDFAMNGVIEAGSSEGTPHKGAFNLKVTGTDVAKFFTALDQPVFASGTMNYEQSLSFNGLTQTGIVKSLSGQGMMNGANGAIKGMDLNALSEKLEDPNSLIDFVALFDQLTAGGETQFEDFSAPVTIQNGVVKSDSVKMVSEDVSLLIKGQADLPEWTVNANGTVNFTARSNIPPLSMTIYGTLDNPQKRFDQDNIMRFLRGRATKALGRKISEQLLGGDGAAPANDNTQQVAPTQQKQQQQPASPEDALKDAGQQLLRGLMGQ